MKTAAFFAVLLMGMGLMQAKDAPSYQSGTLKEMASVDCGYEQKSAKGFVGELIGTDDSHSKTRKTFCQEYVLETNLVVYRIRPKQEHPALLPVGEKAMFRMKKNYMVLKVPEADNKEREYDVVSATPAQANNAEPKRTPLSAPAAPTSAAGQSKK